MSWSDQSKLERLFKARQGKTHTGITKQFYEETLPAQQDIHIQEVYVDEIPSIPPVQSTAVIEKWYPGDKGRVVLTCDRSVPDRRCWVALVEWKANWSSGSGNPQEVLRNFIPPKYGVGYTVRVYRGNGAQIPELDPVAWLFDYKNGILTFEQDPGLDGTAPESSVQIEVYRYVGRIGLDLLAAVGDNELLQEVSAAVAGVQRPAGKRLDYRLDQNELEILKEKLTPKALWAIPAGDKVYVTWAYEDIPELTHFVLEYYDPNTGRWVPFDGQQGIVPR